MSNHSVIEHRANYHFVKMEEDYILICGSGKQYPHCKAFILSVLEHWTNDKLSKGQEPYVYMTYPEWIDAMYGLFRRNTIIASMAELEKERLVLKRPCKRYGKDTFEYALNVSVIQARIRELTEREEKNTRPKVNAFKFKRVEKQTGANLNGTTDLNLNASKHENAFKSKRNIDSITEIPSNIDNISADAERTHASSDYPIATPSHDTTTDEAEQGDTHGTLDHTAGSQHDSNIHVSQYLQSSVNSLQPRNDLAQEIDDAAYDAFFAPFPPEILAHPGKQAELSPSNVESRANGVDKPVQDTQKTGKPRGARTPKAKDVVTPEQIEAVFSCLDGMARKVTGDEDFTYTRTKAAQEDVRKFLTGRRATHESLKAVYQKMWDTPADPKTGFDWKKNMSIKAICNNHDRIWLSIKAETKDSHAQTENGKKVSAAVAAGYTDYTGSEPMNYRPLRMPSDRNRKRA